MRAELLAELCPDGSRPTTRGSVARPAGENAARMRWPRIVIGTADVFDVGSFGDQSFFTYVAAFGVYGREL